MTTLLASLEDFASIRGVTFDPAEVGAIISLEMASEAVRTWCDQTFDLVTDDEVVLDGNGTNELRLPQHPVVSVSAVEAVWDWDDTPTVFVEGTDYKFDAIGQMLRRPRNLTWPLGIQNVTVTYTHGYILPGEDGANVPMDLQGVVLGLAGRKLAAGLSGGAEVQTERIGTYSVTFDTSAAAAEELDRDEMVSLARYRVLDLA